MEFTAENPVADIHQRGGITGFYQSTGCLGIGQGNDAFTGMDRLITLGVEVIEKLFSVIPLVKMRASGGNHLFDFIGDSEPLLFHLFYRFRHSDGIPGFKRPSLEIEPPSDRPIDLDNGVRNFRNPVGGVDQAVGERLPGKTPAGIVGIDHGF